MDKPCKLWNGSMFPNGYGQCYKWYKGKLIRYIHVYSWISANDSFPPDGFEIGHLCHIKHCYEPTHLELQTHLKNMRNRRHGKLYEEEVKEIRRLGNVGILTHEEIGARFGVTKSTVGRIIKRRIWKNV